MPKSGLSGPFRLTFEAIECAVARESAGAYVLGHTIADGRFHANYVGSADKDLKRKLCDHIGSAGMFKYEYLPSAKHAFERECQLFHELSPPGNRVHPGRPHGTTWGCPRCRIFAG